MILHTVVTPPAAEPVLLAEAKSHLRILHDSEDALVALYALAARQHIEETTGTAMISRTIDAFFPAWPRDGVLILPWAPLVSVTSVTYRDADGATQTLAADQYEVVTESLLGRVVRAAGVVWPSLTQSPKAVAVRYVAGYGASGASVPEPLRAAVRLLTEHYYYRRGATSETRAEPVPMAVGALTAPYRTFGWG